jgi:hypothetical protein
MTSSMVHTPIYPTKSNAIGVPSIDYPTKTNVVGTLSSDYPTKTNVVGVMNCVHYAKGIDVEFSGAVTIVFVG